MEVDLQSLIASIFRPLDFQWARIEARVWLHLPFRTRHQKLIVNAAVAIFRGQKIAEAPGCRIFGGSLYIEVLR